MQEKSWVTRKALLDHEKAYKRFGGQKDIVSSAGLTEFFPEEITVFVSKQVA